MCVRLSVLGVSSGGWPMVVLVKRFHFGRGSQTALMVGLLGLFPL